MVNDKQLNANGLQLSKQLTAAKTAQAKEPTSRLINVAGVGRVVSTAYEQLRNAAEYAQEHLLIQNAIRRYFVRNINLHNHGQVSKTIAEELIIELTQSGYIKNNTQSYDVVEKMGSIIEKHYDNFWRLKAAGVDDHKARDWTLDLMSIECEDLMVDDVLQTIYLQFAYHHYMAFLQKKIFASGRTEEASFEVDLYIAVHRALLKSDISAVRYDMQKLYKTSDKNINDYIQFHKNIDDAFSSPVTNKTMRYINKYGAPLRVLRSFMQENDRASELLTQSNYFDEAFSAQIKKDYRKSESKLNKGLIKSIIFLLITKSLIGVGIEVPFDLATTGVILYIPLIVNLLTPVIYLAIIRLGFKLPGETNAKAIKAYADDMLYGDQSRVNLYPTIKDRTYPIGFKIAYAMLFLVVFGFVSYVLMLLHFSIVQGLIFFTFLAAASFLGFGLSRIVRELELVSFKPGALTTFQDLLFTPFTFLGKWISEKYQKVNIVALVLDTIIELPLKTALRLLRQWTGFIDEKKDQI